MHTSMSQSSALACGFGIGAPGLRPFGKKGVHAQGAHARRWGRGIYTHPNSQLSVYVVKVVRPSSVTQVARPSGPSSCHTSKIRLSEVVIKRLPQTLDLLVDSRVSCVARRSYPSTPSADVAASRQHTVRVLRVHMCVCVANTGRVLRVHSPQPTAQRARCARLVRNDASLKGASKTRCAGLTPTASLAKGGARANGRGAGGGAVAFEGSIHLIPVRHLTPPPSPHPHHRHLPPRPLLHSPPPPPCRRFCPRSRDRHGGFRE